MSVFTEVNTGPLLSEEVEVDQPELENKYKIDDQEVIVLTGRNPKCPAGYNIIKTDLNPKNSSTNVMICAKNLKLGQNNKPTSNDNGLDWQDNIALGVSDTDYQNLRFPFNYRDDAFADNDDQTEELNYSKLYYNPGIPFELCIILLIVIISIIYVLNDKNNKKETILNNITK